MKYRNPMFELLDNLEQIIFKDVSQTVTLLQKASPSIEFEQLRRGADLKTDDFVRVMGVTVAIAHEWEPKRVKPPTTELKLMCLIQAGLELSKRLMD